MAFILYGLRKPGEEARYIGIVSTTLKKRLASHLSVQSDDHRGHWIAKAKREKAKVEIVPYCVGLSEKEACELEIAVIAELRKIGLDLVNTHEGGNLPPSALGRKPSANQLASMVGNKYALGHKHSPEWKAALSVRMLGNIYSLGKNLGNKNALGKNLGNKNASGKHSPEQNAKKSVTSLLAWEKRRAARQTALDAMKQSLTSV